MGYRSSDVPLRRLPRIAQPADTLSAVERARADLRARMPFESWTDTEVIACTKRTRRRMEAAERQRKAAIRAERDELQRIIELPDADLAWLLKQGWRP